jgi:hypothetical protein
VQQIPELINSTPTTYAVKLSPGVRDAASEDGAILLDIDNGSCLSLNAVGAKIWQMLKQEWQEDRIVMALQQEFTTIPISQLQQDYLDFVKELERNNLVQIERYTKNPVTACPTQ